MYNTILKSIHQVLGDLVWTRNITQTYFGTDEIWPVILAAAVLEIIMTKNRLKRYIPEQVVFYCDTIILITHKVHWELICQRKYAKLINILYAEIETDLNTTIMSEIKSHSITTLHTNMKLHIIAHLQEHGVLTIAR